MDEKHPRKRNTSKSERNSAKSIQIPESVASFADSSAGSKKGRNLQDYFGETAKQRNRSKTHEKGDKADNKKTGAQKSDRQPVVGENLSRRFEAVSEAKVIKEEETSIQNESWRSENRRIQTPLGVSSPSIQSTAPVVISRDESSFPGPNNTKIEEEDTFIENEDTPEPRVKIEGETIEFGESTDEVPPQEPLPNKSKPAKEKRGDRSSLGNASKFSVTPGSEKELREVFTEKVLRGLVKIEMEMEHTAFHKASFDHLRYAGCRYLNWLLEKSILLMKSQKKKRLTLTHLFSALAEDPRTSFLIDAMTFDEPTREPRKSKPSEADEKHVTAENLLTLPQLSNDRSMSEPLSQIDSNAEVASSTKLMERQANPRAAKSRIESLPEPSSSSHSLQVVKEEPNPGNTFRRTSKSREIALRTERTKKEAD